MTWNSCSNSYFYQVIMLLWKSSDTRGLHTNLDSFSECFQAISECSILHADLGRNGHFLTWFSQNPLPGFGSQDSDLAKSLNPRLRILLLDYHHQTWGKCPSACLLLIWTWKVKYWSGMKHIPNETFVMPVAKPVLSDVLVHKIHWFWKQKSHCHSACLDQEKSF